MEDHRPTILLRGSLSPSTISLSSPNLDSTTITLNLEMCFRNCSGPITVFPVGSFLSSNSQNYYSSTYCLYDIETDSQCDGYVTTSCSSGGFITIKNPEEELLELGTLNAGDDKAPAETDTPRDSLQQSSEQPPFNFKVDIGIHKNSHVTNSSTKPAGPGEVAESEKNGTSSSQPQPKQQFSTSDLSVCAAQLSSLVPGRQYQVRTDLAPGTGPFRFWWWSLGAKADIIANSYKRDPKGLMGPITLPNTGQQVYAIKRMDLSERLKIKVEMVECPVLTVTA